MSLAIRSLRVAVRSPIAIIVVALMTLLALVPASGATTPYRAFTSTSYWNTPLPANAPIHPRSADMINFMKSTNVSSGCPLLSGAETNPWGIPVYWADGSSPTYNVRTTRYAVPKEFATLRIPRGAKPMNASDGEMVVYDLEKGYVAELSVARFDGANWTVEGGSIAYLNSNGIDGRLSGGDSRNSGTFRGYNGAVAVVRYDEVVGGAVDHVLKMGVKVGNRGFQFPMWGSDGQSTDALAPIQGARVRIKPNVNLDSYKLHPQALPIARALQRYGAIIGDTTGAPVELKVEDTIQEGRGQLWTLTQAALCAIPLDLYEFVDYGYVPPAAPEPAPTTSPTPAPTTSPTPAPSPELEQRVTALESAVQALRAENTALLDRVSKLESWKQALTDALRQVP